MTSRTAALPGGSPTILVVEDERIVARDIEGALTRLGYGVVGFASSGEEALRAAVELGPNLVLMDINLRGDIDGITAAELIRAELAVPIIYLTAFSDAETLRRATGSAAYGYLVKPFKEPDLRCAIELALHRHRHTTGLETANRELEAFSDAVSHDLRGPLGRIDGFSRVLLEEHADVLGEDGRRHLQRVRDATTRMDGVIEDLLRLARLAGASLRRTEVDLTVLARTIGASLAEAHPSRTVELVVEDGMRARCDEGLIHLALENLLGNAWKFTARAAAARVEMGARTEPGGPGLIYFIRDNGVGFDPARRARLFLPFQRLHRAEEFEGTGIGLATVQRVIRRHGGRVWADAELGRGATFSFTLE